MPERTKNTMVPWDESFPEYVHHIANPKRVFKVVWYGMESTMYGSVPIVAIGDSDDDWVAGESDVIKGRPTIVAVNGYGDESTALRYASDRNRIWTL